MEVQEEKFRKEDRGEINNIRERLITPLSSPPPNNDIRNHQQPDLPDRTQKKETVLEMMSRKRKEKEDAPIVKKTGKKKEVKLKKWQDDKNVKGSLIVNKVKFDRKTVANDDDR